MDANARIAARLREAAERLQQRGANDHRVEAYRRAAGSVERSPFALRTLYDAHGVAGLRTLPGVGPGIAAAIAEMLRTGRWRRLEGLRAPWPRPRGEERVILYTDEEGLEHECTVVASRASGLHRPWR